MNASNVRDSSSHSTAQTLRPRNRRLISGLDGEDADTPLDSGNVVATRGASPRSSPYDTRPVSPIPAAHPQRSSSSQRTNRYGAGSSLAPPSSGHQRKPDSLAGIWGNSWSALQGMALDFLNNDPSTPAVKDKQRVRRPLSTLDRQRSTSSIQWGPGSHMTQSKSNGIGGGTREEQTLAFRAQKRKDLLTGQESSYADALGKYKRRLSDDRATASAPPADGEDREALVYLHHVSKDDTLAGITIRYNINANTLRKANRMWPNDTVQSRQTLILPVDACGVKGRLVSGPGEEIDLLGSESEALSTLQAEEVPAPSLAAPVQGNANRARTTSTSTNTTTSGAISITDEISPSWTHDSWVMLPGHTKATEIVRLPRRSLAYFPPARRKSNSYSDFDTPRTSLDLARINTPGKSAPNEPTTSSSHQTPPRRSANGRRLSTSTNGYFPSYMSGPGGVGTMSKNVHFPGPAQDGLNKMFAKHLPDVAPPRNQKALYQPDQPLYTDDPTPFASGSATPAYPNSGSGNLNMNFENMGGAIESWVRRIATKATHFPPDRQLGPRASVGTPGKGAGGIGDLIEMTDDFEIGDDDENDDSGRGRQNADSIDVGKHSSSSTSYFDNAVRGRANIGTSRSQAGKSGKVD